jgi:phosphoglucosamine mutase
MKQTGLPLSVLAGGMRKYPQTMINVQLKRRMNPAESPAIQAAVAAAELELKDTGRIVLRASGTEPVIRVMVEGQDETMVRALATRLAAIVSTATN